ncbi:MAG: hypothetical protein KDJ77_07640 [Rhodobiaceae bacterium]|nr:hypothetical protein [Rhodobiaceae bacterium]
MHFALSRTSRNLKRLGGGTPQTEFGYWVLPNGRRFVVSVLKPDSARDLSDSVALIVAPDSGGRRIPLWIGDTGALPGAFARDGIPADLLRRPDVELHVHALASGEDGRREVVETMRWFALMPSANTIAA